MKKLCLYVGGLAAAFALAVLLAGPNTATARPQYQKAFGAKYPKLASQVKKVKCGTCHFGKSKKNRNDYGVELSKHVKKKNQKNKEIINAALDAAAKAKDGKFGKLIEAGKLPGTAPKK